MAATLLTTAQVAEKLDTDPRTLRKFLRADAAAQGTETPGKGSRYSITAKEVAPLKSRFKKWTAALQEAKAAKVEAEAEVIEQEDIDPEAGVDIDAEADAAVDAD